MVLMQVNSVDPCHSHLGGRGNGAECKTEHEEGSEGPRSQGEKGLAVINVVRPASQWQGWQKGQRALVLCVPPLDVSGLVKRSYVAAELRGRLLRDA